MPLGALKPAQLHILTWIDGTLLSPSVALTGATETATNNIAVINAAAKRPKNLAEETFLLFSSASFFIISLFTSIFLPPMLNQVRRSV